MIIKTLQELELEYEIEILFAIESGSRAYGFHSKDSDYDIRFIYKRPLSWYISIQQNQRDVIEIQDENHNLDFVGWDIKKALYLLYKSNPNFLEWLQSPIVYYHDPSFTKRLNELADHYYDPKTCFYHHLSLVRKHLSRYFLDNTPEVSGKKYLYVFRSLFACNWIYRNIEGKPPIEWFKLLGQQIVPPPPFLGQLDDLVIKKKEGSEIDTYPRNPLFDQFIKKQFDKFSNTEIPKRWSKGPKDLDEFLWQLLNSK